MSKQIHLGGVRIPVEDYAVSCNAILGIRDSGKTVTAKGIAEQLIEADIPIVVFDAVGKWRWMKVAGDGPRGKDYKVVVVGGRQPDLPLNPHGIGEIVRSAIKERIPLIIDLYDPKLSKADWRQIVQQSIRIIHYEANGMSHVFLEEAAEFIPQKVMDGQTYAEVEKLARMGGNASVGITIINQRSQEVNKAVLDLSHNLILGCQIGNKAIEAVEKWVDRLAPDVAKAVTSSLPKLKSGEAWIWTRSNPDEPVLEKLPMCRSFHPDRRTPEVVLKSAKPTDINQFVERLGASIPKIIEEAKQNDPAELRKRIRELEKAAPAPKPIETVKEVPIIKDSHIAALEKWCERTTSAVLVISEITKSWKVKAPQLPRPTPPIAVPQRWQKPLSVSVNHANGEVSIGKCERAILTVLAQYPQGRNSNQVAIISGYSVNSGGFNNSLSKLRSSGLISTGQPITATGEGLKILGDWTPLPEGPDLRIHWEHRLGICAKSILSALAIGPMERGELAAASQYSENSGGFNNTLSKLRTLELITRGNPIQLAEELK